MDFQKVAQNRYACHEFNQKEAISWEAFLEILEPVTLTPSGYNAQPWEFILIQDPSTLKEIEAVSFNQKQITESGNLVLVIANREFGKEDYEWITSQWQELKGFTEAQTQALKASLLKERPENQKKEMALRSSSLAAMMFLLSATEKNWQTCPMMGFSQKKVAQIVGLPESYFPVLMVALGKSDSKTNLRLPRKTPESMAHKEFFTPKTKRFKA